MWRNLDLILPLPLLAPAPGQRPWAGMVMVLVMVAIFYVLLIAPMRKRQKQHDELIAGLKTGDKVITTGGVFGTVVGVREDRLKLKVSNNVKIEVTKASIAGLDDEA